MKKRTKNLLIASSIFATITNYTIAKEIKYHQIINNHEHSSTGPEIIAHRGFSGDTLENSNEAIEKADQNECTNRIEIDVRLTADETIVLSHDNHDINTTNFVDLDLPTTKKNQYLILENLLNFDEMTLTKLQRQITTNKGTNTTLEEVLSETEKSIVIDIKFKENETPFINQLLKQTANAKQEIIFQSTNANALLEMQKIAPQFKYYLIIDKTKQLELIEESFDGFTIKHSIITKNLAETILGEQKGLFIWTINDKATIANLEFILGDLINEVGIITDHPDLLCVYKQNIK